MNLPDLRDNPSITIEHCSVLLEKLGKCLEKMYDDPGIGKLASETDAEKMANDLALAFSPEQFHRLFQTELGKGLLVGVFFQRFILDDDDEEVSDE